MVVRNVSRNTTLAEKCSQARTFISRLRGLQLKKTLPSSHGLLITPCKSIHTFFMRFSIDAVFIDENNTVLHIREGIKPRRVSKVVWNSRSVLELPSGVVSATGTKVGDKLEFSPKANQGDGSIGYMAQI
jgi:uncharacterized membrane protein (UPF0127 family)